MTNNMKEESIITQRQFIANFYTANRERLVRFAASRLGSDEEGEDLVQEVFVKLLGYEGLLSEATIHSFAFTIAANKIKDVLRRRTYRLRMEENAKWERNIQSVSAERVVEYHESLERLREGIGVLSPACAKIYRMSFFDEMPADAIAERLHVSKRTVDIQLFRSRKKIRAYMRQEA